MEELSRRVLGAAEYELVVVVEANALSMGAEANLEAAFGEGGDREECVGCVGDDCDFADHRAEVGVLCACCFRVVGECDWEWLRPFADGETVFLGCLGVGAGYVGAAVGHCVSFAVVKRGVEAALGVWLAGVPDCFCLGAA